MRRYVSKGEPPHSTAMGHIINPSGTSLPVDPRSEYQRCKELSLLLVSMMGAKNLYIRDVASSARMEQTQCVHVLGGLRRAARDELVRLGFALGLTADELQRVLKIAGKNPLTPVVRRDFAILHCLSSQNVEALQDFLAQLEEYPIY